MISTISYITKHIKNNGKVVMGYLSHSSRHTQVPVPVASIMGIRQIEPS